MSRNPCPNGAAYWMYVTGITAMVSLAFFAAVRYRGCGDSESSNRCKNGLDCLGMVIMVGLSIAIFAMDIWGFKVVFGAWATWTHDWTEYKKDSENLNYCTYTPMMTAFVILILKAVS